MAKQAQSATSLGISPEEERRERIFKYTIAQVVRVVCIIVAVAGGGNWLTWVAGIGAALLPYYAVVIANATTDGRAKKSVAKAEAPTIAIGADAFRNATRVDAE